MGFLETGKLDDIMDLLLDIIDKIYFSGVDSVDYDNIEIDRPYLEILKDGVAMIVDGRDLPNVKFNAEILYFLNHNKNLDRETVFELLLIEEVLIDIQKCNYQAIYEKVCQYCSDEIILRHKRIIDILSNPK